MIKRTLIAIAVVALLATSVQAGSYSIWDPYYFTAGDHQAVKVDGKETRDFRWPYTISYQELTICNIPIIMKVGMYVQVKECKDKKITLEQRSCSDIGKDDADYPCYLGCEEFEVRANFPVQLGSSLHKAGDMMVDDADWEAYYDGGSTVPGDGDWHNVKICVKAWKAAIYKATPGDEVAVGSVDITVKPNT